MASVRFALIGRSEWLFDAGKSLLGRGHELALVVTAREAPEYRVKEADFKELAASCGCPFLHTGAINSPASLRFIEGAAPIDIGISINYPGILSQEVLDKFPHGVLNAHGGDLPRYRGNACQAWAILNGETHIGLCVHRMLGGELDSGDILARVRLPLLEATRIGEVQAWMAVEIPSLMVLALERLEANPEFTLETQSTSPIPPLRCYPRRPEDGRIDWASPALHLVRLVNASSEPYPGAWCLLEGEPFVVWRAECLEDGEQFCAIPGQVASYNGATGSLAVCTGEGKLLILEATYRGTRTGRPGDLVSSMRSRLT